MGMPFSNNAEQQYQTPYAIQIYVIGSGSLFTEICLLIR